MRSSLLALLAVCLASGLHAKQPLFGDEERLISEAEEQCAALLPAQTADSCLGRSFNITEECKCYWSCFWKKFKFEREDGSIDRDLVMEFIGSYAQSPGDVMSSRVERTVDACVAESTAGCGRVKQILECVGDSYGAGDDSGSEDDYGVS
ncbi:uncharacterized protein LOC134534476 isoform X2 [Bacillus rossius redtenbacheri]|uniref:uncharacterized protein LOC134534476 isoform X2 n=1 Tax=Bacillus rossius redtenbacheri TaxID=93214 RepID=UPI002FDE09AB